MEEPLRVGALLGALALALTDEAAFTGGGIVTGRAGGASASALDEPQPIL